MPFDATALRRNNIVVPQIVATRGSIPGEAITGYQATESRLTARTGCQPCSRIQMAFPSFFVRSDGTGEYDLLNDVTYQAAIEKLGSRNYTVKGTVNTIRDVVVKPGNGFVLTDPIMIGLEAYEDFNAQFGQFVADNTKYYGVGQNVQDMHTGYRATNTIVPSNSNIGKITDDWTTTSPRGSSTNVGTSPIIIGLPTVNYVSCIIFGDSITASREDTAGDDLGNHGWFQRGLYTAGPGGNVIPWANLARSGEKATTVANGGAASRLQLFRYASHCIYGYGTNDFGPNGNISLTSVQSATLAAWRQIKLAAPNIQIFVSLLTPRSSSTDQFTTRAGQTPVAGWESGGRRDQFNAWVRTQVGINIDGIIDLNTIVEDTGKPGCWITNGTVNYPCSDGLHPSAAIHALAAPLVTSIASKWRLPSVTRAAG